ncbi:hypothetical protein pEaSNUABM40_00210 [Erwinia phage pEa_SNUABM_40]|uniref:Uncharacterized protein n=1 Tax=Erwinia phage pEa_SNUABM_3 TaxID=2869552 RepID=A0AAE7XJY7_9CAUD|nr:hypothetical protein MPK68_gp207 [Erwinia phage pEa_SNUABM_3]QZE56743.1 hypothetical protein pEaSNUABM20_00207 [Erwinia phage pEa_SNUABM_20]QZE58426.1 hypothetical protein pEaSNUABM40_00210 [Erwinia phage pEa_SNUABM_40]UAW52988.1 hypothetical protein pEaSNUABM23_00206 [Erwinia phage pEa_SNUABM_23]UIW10884.1 hypothetical protein pEaSNUABM23_00206 [Erwinia phage pEa_SNUABM_31]QZE56404.1 hypothetical protein pEaSNUABM3_00207 [Erwinia phage pEa_SNUABM_3]
MEIQVSLSVRTSPLEDTKVSLENSKDDLKGAQRRAAVARKKLNDKQSEGDTKGVTSARDEVNATRNSVKTQQDIVRVNQQRVSRAAVVDRLVKEWNRLDKLKGTEQDTAQIKERRATVAKQIVEARKALQRIKRPKSAIKKPKKPRRY